MNLIIILMIQIKNLNFLTKLLNFELFRILQVTNISIVLIL